MKRLCILSLSLAVLPACSGDDSTPGANTEDASLMDSSTPEDTGTTPPTPDTGTTPPTDAGVTPDTGTGVSDAEVADADAGVEADASDGGCPTSWFVAPVTDPSIAVAGRIAGRGWPSAASTNRSTSSVRWTTASP